MSEKIMIRTATTNDAEAILAIYAPYVETTAITFEYEIPGIEEFRERIRNVLKKYPYLIAEAEGEIVGYAYAGPFKGRAAYDWAVETTIYVDRARKRMGIGRKLYDKLEEALRKQGILNMEACSGYPETEDEHLTKDSVRFHEKLGYRMVGEFYQCGYKFSHWYNMVWMEKMIGEHQEKQPQIHPYSEIENNVI